MSILGNPLWLAMAQECSGGGKIAPLNVTANGTYIPSSGIDGYAPITVNVPSSSSYNSFVGTETPTTEMGNNGDYYFELVNTVEGPGLDAPFESNASSTGGYSFTVKSGKNVAATGVRVKLRANITGAVEFGTVDGTLIKSVSVSYNAGSWSKVLFDEPVSLNAGVEYSVVFNGSGGSMFYQGSPSSYANDDIVYITGRYGSFPGASEGNAYSCDVIIQRVIESPPFPVKKQYYKSNGLWLEVT